MSPWLKRLLLVVLAFVCGIIFSRTLGNRIYRQGIGMTMVSAR